MKRVDLRHLKNDFLSALEQNILTLNSNEVCIYLFEIGDFNNIKKSVELAYKNSCEIMNSLKFNQVDWMIVVKKLKDKNEI